MRNSLNIRFAVRTAFLAPLILVAVTSCPAQLIPNLGGQRVGITAFQFLKIGVGARGVALGETFVAIANDASALYWNPAGLAQFPENEMIFAHTEYVVDIKHEFLGAVYHLGPGDALGFSVTSLHTADMEITTETHQFSFGITLRYVEETLDLLKMRGIVADLGTYYWTGLGTSRFSVVVTNFGADVAPTGEATEFGGGHVNSFQSFSPPTQFKIGFAMEPVQMENQRVTTSVELNHPNDNAENVHLGIEYQWEQWIWLRTGLKRTIGERLFGRDNATSSDVTFGVGVAAPVATNRVNVDYAYANFNTLGSVHRISLGLTF